MLFNSLPFLVFFPVVTVLYFLLAHKYRWLLLLLASCFFYMFFKPEYIIILAFTIIIDYCAGILLENEQDKVKKKKYLVMSLIANIGVLAIFKYYNFLNTNISGLSLLLGYKNPIPFLKVVLPIGLSFHTFQAMSYTIEVYRGSQKAERHFGIYALYVMFYPQLVAGPIERPQNILHQFYEKHYFNYNNAVTGIRFMLWGMFKKVVIADRLSVVTDAVFNSPQEYSAISISTAAIFFSFQIYCDFSGYSDIAIGSAQVMGFDLMKNFNRPYSARTIADFWRRWHISLSTWFRDYLYIPLGGNRVAVFRRHLNIFIVFLLSGLWHGANWTFIIWGALHGFYSVFGNITAGLRSRVMGVTGIGKMNRVNDFIQKATTFVLVTIAWIFFRANNVADAVYIFKKLPSVSGELLQGIHQKTAIAYQHIPSAKLWPCVLIIAIMEAIHIAGGKRGLNTVLQSQPRYLRWGIYYFFVMTILYFGVFENRQFIYFQF